MIKCWLFSSELALLQEAEPIPSNMDITTQAYARVDMLYGPGAVTAWLLTILSVLISFTKNKVTRREDTISYDFLAALALPTLAAGNLFYLLSQLPDSAAETLIARDIDAM